MDHHDDYFPELNQKKLSQFASSWANQFPGVKKITLTAISDRRERCRYLISFLPENQEAYEKLYAEIMSLDNMASSFSGLIGDGSFFWVYRKEPDPKFRDDWTFEVLLPESEPEQIFGWTLFPSENVQKKTLIKEVSEKATGRKSADDQVRTLRVWVETDEEVGFQIPGQKRFLYTADMFNFRSSDNDQWLVLIRSLKREGLYDTRTIRPGKSMAANRVMLTDQINRHLLPVLRSLLPGADMPDNYRVWEPVKYGDRKGVLRFKFHVLSPSKTRDSFPETKEELNQRLDHLLKRWKQAQKRNETEAAKGYFNQIIYMEREACERGLSTEEEFKDLLERAQISR